MSEHQTIKSFTKLLSQFPTPRAHKYTNCIPYLVAERSTVYAHNREHVSWFSATGKEAVEFCQKHLGVTTHQNSHHHYTWYLYS